MSQINRLTVSRGPALVTFGGGSFLSAADMVVEFKHDSFTIPSDAYGKLDEVQLGVKASLKFKPVGEFEHLGVLWPHASTVPGTSIFGGSDAPLIIKPLDSTQRQVTFKAAGISKMPDLNFTTKETLIGDVEFQMVGANNTAVDNAERLFLFATNTISTIPYDPTKLLVQSYAADWHHGITWTITFGANTTTALAYDATEGTIETAFNALASVIALTGGAATVEGTLATGITITYDALAENVAQATASIVTGPPGSSITAATTSEGSTGNSEIQTLTLSSAWTSFESRNGLKVSFGMQTSEDESDAIGHYDTIFRGLDVTVKGQPQGVALESILEAARIQGSTSVRGRRFSTGTSNLRITGEGVYFLLYGAALDGAGIVRSSTNQAVPELTWKGARTVASGGTINPLFYVGTAAP